jgi:hypothetical protein
MATDVLGTIRGEIDTRLEELRGFVEEHEALSAASIALDDVTTNRASVAPRKPRGRPPGVGKGRGRPSGQRPGRPPRKRSTDATPTTESPTEATATTTSSPAPAKLRRRGRRGKRARRGANSEAILSVITGQPDGASRATIIANSGVKDTIVYGELKKLETAGKIVKTSEGRQASYSAKQAPAASE